MCTQKDPEGVTSENLFETYENSNEYEMNSSRAIYQSWWVVSGIQMMLPIANINTFKIWEIQDINLGNMWQRKLQAWKRWNYTEIQEKDEGRTKSDKYYKNWQSNSKILSDT